MAEKGGCRNLATQLPLQGKLHLAQPQRGETQVEEAHVQGELLAVGHEKGVPELLHHQVLDELPALVLRQVIELLHGGKIMRHPRHRLSTNRLLQDHRTSPS